MEPQKQVAPVSPLPKFKKPTQSRSRMMSAIRGKGNRSTELAMATYLRKAGLKGWRRHLHLPGTPDFAWPAQRVALFVDGCFWHGCPNCYSAPRRNRSFWAEKLRRNRQRDIRAASTLRSQGWSVFRVWECKVDSQRTISTIGRCLRKRTISARSAG
jgi:DNA mismatch endonuclease, patch repair protein